MIDYDPQKLSGGDKVLYDAISNVPTTLSNKEFDRVAERLFHPINERLMDTDTKLRLQTGKIRKLRDKRQGK